MIGFYYLAYRYPLQINSSTTSPTYSDTPPLLQGGKYVLIGLVLLWALMTMAVLRRSRQERRAIREPFRTAHAAFVLLAMFGIGKGLVLLQPELIAFGVVAVAGVIVSPLALREPLDTDRIEWHIKFYAVASLLTLGAEYALYRRQGRLPALAYEDSVSVRFGAILDDPNGYAFLVMLLAPVVWIGWKRRRLRRLLIAGALLGSLTFTQSFTGIAAAVGAFALGGVLLHSRDSPARMVGMLYACLLIAVAGWVALPRSETFVELLADKSGSIANHMLSIDRFLDLSLADVAGLGVAPAVSESGYVGLIEMFGVPGLLLYVGLGVFSVAQLRRQIRAAAKAEDVAVQYGFFFFQITVMVGMFNLRISDSFPIDLLFVIGVSVSLFRTTVPGRCAESDHCVGGVAPIQPSPPDRLIQGRVEEQRAHRL